MNKFKSLIAIALFAFALVSCTKLEKVLPKSGGVWKATSLVNVSYENGAETGREITPNDSLPTYTFNDDETGKVTSPGEPDETFTWTTNSDGDKLTLTQTSLPIAITIDVLELKAKSQTWFFAFETGAFREETTVLLERQ